MTNHQTRDLIVNVERSDAPLDCRWTDLAIDALREYDLLAEEFKESETLYLAISDRTFLKAQSLGFADDISGWRREINSHWHDLKKH